MDVTPSTTLSFPPVDLTTSHNNHSISANLEVDSESYCSPEMLKDFFVSTQSLKVLHVNLRSLTKNFDKLHRLMCETNLELDVIGITETKLNDIRTPPMMDDYDFLSNNSSTNAGGVGLYIKSKLPYNKVDDFTLKCSRCEDLWIKIHYKKPLTIGVVYRHPGYNITEFKQKFEKSLEILNEHKSSFVIVGDFNIDLCCDVQSSTVIDYKQTYLSLGCTQHIDKPTRLSINCDKSSLLDHIYSNLKDDQIKCKILLNDISDHLPIVAEINTEKINEFKDVITRRNMSNFNSKTFLADLELELKALPSIICASNLNSYIKEFLDKYQKIIENHAPLQNLDRRKKKLRHKPWITKDILKMIKLKDRLFRIFTKKKTRASRKHYVEVRNRLTHIIEGSKTKYYDNIFKSSECNPKALWKNIRKVTQPNKTDTINMIIDENDSRISSPKDLSNSFNNFFSDIGYNVSRSLPKVGRNNSPTSLLKSVSSSVYFEPITVQEISSLISELDQGKSSPSFSPSIRFIKLSAKVIAPILADIFNCCLLTGEFPDSFKLAEVIPIFKSGKKTNLTNYRPISLLSPFSKLLEKCINKRLTSFFTKNNLLYNYQFGFRNNSSTENAVLQICEQLSESCDKKQLNCAVFIDLRKAFDTVNHDILIRKLQFYGVRGIPLTLINSFLTGRKQYTLVKGCKSKTRGVTCGVPQGSILGPFLFLVYVNDLHLATNLKVNLFADDAYISGNNVSEASLESEMNDELEKIFHWLNANKLSLNISKTSYMIIPKSRSSYNYQIRIGNEAITRVHEAKYLGVIMDDSLSWKPHIEKVRAKLAKGCWAMKRLQEYVSSDVLLKVYYGLVLSNLQYCISCWGWIAGSNQKCLQVLQNRAVRMICKVPSRTHSPPLYYNLKLLQVDDIYKLQVAKIMYKFDKKNWLGSYEMKKINEVHDYFTRFSQSNYYSRQIANNKTMGALTAAGPRKWSDIPENIKSLDFYNFKFEYKNYLLEQYRNT